MVLALAIVLGCTTTLSTVDSGTVTQDTAAQDSATDTAAVGEDTAGDTGGDTGAEPYIDPSPLQLCINEFMPDNLQSWTDETGAYVDWIELHNPTDEEVLLAGWSITDDSDEPDKHVFGDEMSVLPGAFAVLAADGEPSLGAWHLPFRLDNDGEEIGLYRWDGTGEVLGYGEVFNDLSVARVTDCGAIEDMDYVYKGTPGESNVVK